MSKTTMKKLHAVSGTKTLHKDHHKTQVLIVEMENSQAEDEPFHLRERK